MIKSYMLNKTLILLTIFIIILFSPFISSYVSKQEYVEINREIKSEVFNKYDSENILIFFGYVGCIDICTPRLNEVSIIYEDLKKLNIDVKVLFVNLTKQNDPELVDLFAKSFNENFEGIYLEKSELNSLKKEFRVYSALKLGSSYEVDHTAFLYLIKKVNSKYYLNKIYIKVPFNVPVNEFNL